MVYARNPVDGTLVAYTAGGVVSLFAESGGGETLTVALATLDDFSWEIALSPDEQWLVSASASEDVVVFSVKDQKRVRTLKGHKLYV